MIRRIEVKYDKIIPVNRSIKIHNNEILEHNKRIFKFVNKYFDV